MKTNHLILAIVIVLTLAATPIFAQKTTRVKFARGATQAVVKGKLNSYKDAVDYVVRLRKGQTLEVSADKAITLTVLDPSGEDVMDRAANCNGTANISPTVEGDYKIRIVECEKTDEWRGIFRLTVKAK